MSCFTIIVFYRVNNRPVIMCIHLWQSTLPYTDYQIDSIIHSPLQRFIKYLSASQAWRTISHCKREDTITKDKAIPVFLKLDRYYPTGCVHRRHACKHRQCVWERAYTTPSYRLKASRHPLWVTRCYGNGAHVALGMKAAL